MGEAILRGFLASGNAGGTEIAVYDRIRKNAGAGKGMWRYERRIPGQLVQQSDILLIAIKPNVCSNCLRNTRTCSPESGCFDRGRWEGSG
jgi:pyrroline-5-carboxylate reductase